ncbi:hypothetical protein DLAC_03051 [Tieghemostelium lacteum]|uniref:Uncharacterized protein n=1 Tax=Tieghemostelium lacteum TaxID=361077 RepID=A0A152A2L7_TIELA|nr:hypothetical protein DLAC_03051 [Tieghemostelium lacteum]|eukprot:KYR00311.1 hypothetical protein DLAC_03051 [Tieghemostelium lacteum]
MSTLIDLDFEDNSNKTTSNVDALPLGSESLISYNSPKSKKSNNIVNNKNKNNNITEKDVFDDLGISKESHVASNQSEITNSMDLIDFSSPPTKLPNK